MKFAIGDANRMWVALNDASIHFTADNLHTWDAACFPTTPGGQGPITGIVVDPNDTNPRPRSRLLYIGFGEVDTGTTTTSTFTAFNTGTKDLNILGVSRKDGSSDFDLVSPPGFPLLLSPTIDQEFTVQFKPSSNGPLNATF